MHSVSVLSATLRRVQLTNHFSTGVDCDVLQDVKDRAINRCVATAEYLAVAISILKKQRSGRSLSIFFWMSLLNIVKAIFRGSKAYENTTERLDVAIASYTLCIVDVSARLNVRFLEQARELERKARVQQIDDGLLKIQEPIQNIAVFLLSLFGWLWIVHYEIIHGLVEEHRDDDILRWISPSHWLVEEQLEKSPKIRNSNPEALHWVLEMPKIRNRKSDASDLLNRTMMVPRRSGIGKSVMAGAIIQSFRGAQGSLVACLFLSKISSWVKRSTRCHSNFGLSNHCCTSLLEPKVLEDSASSISRKFCYTQI